MAAAAARTILNATRSGDPRAPRGPRGDQGARRARDPPRGRRGRPDRGAIDPVPGADPDALLADRPLAVEQPSPSLTALANRVVADLETR
jgi:hypothetical protein